MLYPALDVANADGELVLAVADDYAPTAVEDHDGSLTIFFSDGRRRDAAREAIASRWPRSVTTAREVDDEDWARRSQLHLEPVTVGRITVVPDPRSLSPDPRSLRPNPQSPIPNPLVIVIEPSMGFGTGHHATTRLCLAALQAVDLAGAFVIDVGTGSGILAIAARRLGARRALGIDSDPDAVQAARANLVVNPGFDGIAFEEADLTSPLVAPPTPALGAGLGQADVVTANLTGALLIRAARLLAAAVLPGGSLIVSGLLAAERDRVAAAFAPLGLHVVWESEEEGWVGLVFKSQVSNLKSES